MLIVLFIFGTVLAFAPKYANDCEVQGGWNDENSLVSDNHQFMNISLQYFSDKEERILLYTNYPFQN